MLRVRRYRAAVFDVPKRTLSLLEEMSAQLRSLEEARVFFHGYRDSKGVGAEEISCFRRGTPGMPGNPHYSNAGGWSAERVRPGLADVCRRRVRMSLVAYDAGALDESEAHPETSLSGLLAMDRHKL